MRPLAVISNTEKGVYFVVSFAAFRTAVPPQQHGQTRNPALVPFLQKSNARAADLASKIRQQWTKLGLRLTSDE
jgi:hypothetical protein